MTACCLEIPGLSRITSHIGARPNRYQLFSCNGIFPLLTPFQRINISNNYEEKKECEVPESVQDSYITNTYFFQKLKLIGFALVNDEEGQEKKRRKKTHFSI